MVMIRQLPFASVESAVQSGVSCDNSSVALGRSLLHEDSRRRLAMAVHKRLIVYTCDSDRATQSAAPPQMRPGGENIMASNKERFVGLQRIFGVVVVGCVMQ